MVKSSIFLILVIKFIDCNYGRSREKFTRSRVTVEKIRKHHGLIGLNIGSLEACKQMAGRMFIRKIIQRYAYKDGYCYLVSRRLRVPGLSLESLNKQGRRHCQDFRYVCSQNNGLKSTTARDPKVEHLPIW